MIVPTTPMKQEKVGAHDTLSELVLTTCTCEYSSLTQENFTKPASANSQTGSGINDGVRMNWNAQCRAGFCNSQETWLVSASCE